MSSLLESMQAHFFSGLERESHLSSFGIYAGTEIDSIVFYLYHYRKEELKAKFQRDNKGMNEKRAEEEVSKFLMDSEMVNAYIEFEKDKVLNPPDLRAEAEQNLSDPKTIATYAAWLIGGAGFGFVRKEIIEPKYASGEWEEIHISLPSWIPQMKPASEKAAEAAESTVQSASEIVSSAMVGSGAAFHSIQEAIGTHLSNF